VRHHAKFRADRTNCLTVAVGAEILPFVDFFRERGRAPSCFLKSEILTADRISETVPTDKDAKKKKYRAGGPK